MSQARLPFTFTSSLSHSLGVTEFQQSSSPLLLLSGSCHQWSLGGLWVACMVLCGSPSSCQGGWSPPWGAGPGDTRLFPLEALVHLSCFVWQLIGDTPCSDPQFSSYLWAPSWLITHPQAKLCHSSCSATERPTPIYSCPLPVLPKGPVSLHCLTPTCQLLYLASDIPAGSQNMDLLIPLIL